MNSSEQLVQEYYDVLGGIGCFQRRYKMVLQANSVALVQVARRVPFAHQEPLRAELDRMKRADIITKVAESTDWVSSLMITTKEDRKLRVCLNPIKINQCLKREHYEMPRRKDLLQSLQEHSFFLA